MHIACNKDTALIIESIQCQVHAWPYSIQVWLLKPIKYINHNISQQVCLSLMLTSDTKKCHAIGQLFTTHALATRQISLPKWWVEALATVIQLPINKGGILFSSFCKRSFHSWLIVSSVFSTGHSQVHHVLLSEKHQRPA